MCLLSDPDIHEHQKWRLSEKVTISIGQHRSASACIHWIHRKPPVPALPPVASFWQTALLQAVMIAAHSVPAANLVPSTCRQM